MSLDKTAIYQMLGEAAFRQLVEHPENNLIQLLGEAVVRRLLQVLQDPAPAPAPEPAPAPATSNGTPAVALLLGTTPAPLPLPAGYYGSVELKRMHRRLLEKATTTAVTSRKIIQAAGYKFNSSSRAALTLLCRLGLLTRDAWGLYVLPSQDAAAIPAPEVNGHAAH